MSCWTNGSYVPEGMDFGEWVEYLDYMVDTRHAFEEDPEYKEFLEDILEDEEWENELELSEEDLTLVNERVEQVMDNLEEHLSGRTKEDKLNILSELHRQNQSRLLFDYIKENGSVELELVFLSDSRTFLEDEQRARTFTDICKILDAKSFDPENRELMDALNAYETVLENEPWAEKHSHVIDNWINSKAGDKSAVCTKILDAKVQMLSDTISREPVKQKPKRRDYDYDWDR